MLPVFAALALVFAGLDHVTTWLCLRGTVPGWEIREANPLAAWLFGQFGLVGGLLLDTAVTLAVVYFLARVKRVPRAARLGLLGLLIVTSAYAVANNFDVIQQIGLLGPDL
jgi:Domain of unknown function (DUF5658)